MVAGCEKQTQRPNNIIPEDETIAVVNNKKISLSQFQERLGSFFEQYDDLIVQDEKRINQLKEIVVNQLIDEELLNQEAARKGIQVADEELAKEMNKLISERGRNSFSPYFSNIKLTEKQWKSRLQSYLSRKKLIQQEVISKIPITKREISSYYEAHKNDFTIPQAYLVRNITLATNDEAEAIRSKIDKGTNFQYLVQEHSISPDKDRDGELGYIEKGDLPLEMETEIFSQRKNSQFTDVIRSQDGYHILKLEKYRKRKRLNLNEARTSIKEILIDQKKDEAYQRWLDKLKENATISINQTALTREEGF